MIRTDRHQSVGLYQRPVRLRQLDSGREDSVFYALVVTLAVFALLSIVVAAPFYIFATTRRSRHIVDIAMIGGRRAWLQRYRTAQRPRTQERKDGECDDKRIENTILASTVQLLGDVPAADKANGLVTISAYMEL